MKRRFQMKFLLFVLLVVMVTVVHSFDSIIPGCTGCSVKGICYFPNQKWKQGCWTKKCTVYPNGYGWRTDIIKTQCPDTYGRCVDHGKMNADGKCTCIVIGLHWHYSCKGK